MGRKENKGPADHYKPLHLLQKSHREAVALVLRCREKQWYCCLSAYVLYITYVLCISYMLLIVKGTKEITCQIF